MDASVSDTPRQSQLSLLGRVRWVAVSAATASIIGVILTLLGYAWLASAKGRMDNGCICLSMPVVGLAISTAQWLVLRASIPKLHLWLIMSYLVWFGGYGIGTIVGGVIGYVVDPKGALGVMAPVLYPGPRGITIGSPFVGATTGLILGAMQMMALVDAGRKPGWGCGFWPIANAAGWGLGFLAAFMFAANVGASGEDLHPLAIAGSFPVCAVVSAAVTGWALGFVLNAPPREHKIPS